MRTFICCLVLGLVTACGSSVANEKPGSAADETSGKADKASAKEQVGADSKSRIPFRCAKGKKHRDECLLSPGWVKRLCDDVYPDVALHMFMPGTPWKRLYMLSRAEPFNASDGS